jgi:tRNA(Ile)-lysidine synthase
LKKSGFHFDQCKSILLAMNGQPGKKFLSASHQLVVDRQHLILSALRADLQEVTTIEQGQRNAFLGNRKLTLTSTDTAVAIDPSRNMAMLDERLIRFPLTWRTWKPGDSFLPLGMANSKKISDLLIDQKVSMADKDLVTILESAGELVWVVGHRIADPFKITANTNRVLVIGLE